MGIFPYVLKLLQSSARELRPLLVFIWAKILAVDSVSNFRSAPRVGSRALPVDLELPHLRGPRSRWGQPSLCFLLFLQTACLQSVTVLLLSYSLPTKTCPSLYQPLHRLSVFCVSLSPAL